MQARGPPGERLQTVPRQARPPSHRPPNPWLECVRILQMAASMTNLPHPDPSLLAPAAAARGSPPKDRASAGA